MVVLLVASLATASGAGAVTLDAARSKALRATKAERARGGVILFSLRVPVRAGTRIREAGSPLASSGLRTRTMPGVMRVGREWSYFFYLDRGSYQASEHRGRVLLVGAASGRVTRSRTIRFAPVINGRLPAFLRSREGYGAPRYRVASSNYSVRGAAARAASAGLGAFGALPAIGLRSAASESAVAVRLAAERSCTVAVDGRSSNRLSSLGSPSGSSVLPLLVYTPTSGQSLASFVTSEAIARRGCRDVLIAVSGDGRRSAPQPSVRTHVSTTNSRVREYHVTAAMLRAIIAANASVTFKLMVDAPGSGAFIESLRSLPNVLLIATSSTAAQTAFRHLPQKTIAGRRTGNPLRLRADSSFLTTQLFGAAAFAASDAEVAHASSEVAARRGPSFLAWMIARGFALSRPFDFTADLGATQRLYISGWVATPPAGGAPANLPPVATAQAVTAVEDTPTTITLAGSDPDGNPLTFAITGGPAHGTLSGTAPNLTYTPLADYAGPDSFTFTVSDGTLVSAVATVAIAVTGVQDAPVTAASGTLAYTENDPATAIAPALTVTDVDSPNLTGATVQITAGLQSGADVLALPSQPSIAGAYDAAGGTLTLSGSATVAAYQAALRALTYRNTSDDPTTTPRTLTFRARDAGGFGNAATRTITVAPVNDAPAIVTSAGPLGYTENDPATPIDAGLVLTDPDSQITGATVQITGNLASAEDLLALASPPAGITAAYVAATGRLTLSGTAGVAAYQTALRAVTYRNTSNTPSLSARTVTFIASDASSSSPPATRTINISATDNAPDVDNSAGALAYTENGPATAIDAVISITDADSVNLTGATVQITGDYVQGQDLLALPAQPIITASFDASTGRLTLSGTATVAAYEAALEAVTYRNTSDNPSTATRTVTYQARDATGFGVADTHAITVAAVDDPPVAVNDSATVGEDSGANTVLVLANDTDVDAGPKSVSTVGTAANGTVVNNGTSVSYTPNANYCNSPPGTTPDTLTYTLNGGSIATVSVTVSCADDAPTAVNDAATVSEDAGANTIGVLSNDTDIDGGPKSVTAVGTAANGTVVNNATSVSYTPNANYCNSQPGGTPDTFTYTINGGSQATVSVTVSCADDPPVAVNDSATVAEDAGANTIGVLSNDTDIDGGPKSVTAVGTAANGTVVNNATSVSYTPNANYCNSQPGGTPDTFTYTITGGSQATVSVTVTCASDAPVVDNAAGTTGYIENAPAVPIDPAVTVSDIDPGATITGATVRISTNFAAQDVLALSGIHPLITPMFAGDTLTLSGTASVAEYQSVLRDVTYRNTSDTPSTLTRTVTFTVTGGDALTGSDTRNVQVTAVDDAPVAVNDSATVNEDSGATTINVLANDTDVDAGPKSVASVTGAANGNVTNNTTNVSYTPNANYCNNPPGTAPDTLTYTLNGGSTATVSVTVTCAADAPIVDASAGNLAYTENDPATPIDASITVTDRDAGATITGATVAITANFAAGQDVLALGNPLTHAPIGAMFAGNTLTLSGTASPAAYQAALRDVTYVNTSEGPSNLTRTVTFTVTDNTALSGSDTRGTTVTGVNDPPTAVNDTGTTDEDTPLNVSAAGVLANDTDLDPGDTKTVVALNGSGTLTGSSAEGGSVTISASGSYTYTPPAAFQALATGESDTDFFGYTMADGAGAQSTATVNITVNGISDAPVAADDTFNAANSAVGNTALVVDDPTDAAPALAAPKKSITGDILANDNDPDSAILTVAPGTFTSNDGATVTIESDGDFTYTSDPADACGDPSDFFTYTVTDGVASDTGQVNIAVTGCVWYVSNSAAGNAGTSTAPFDTLAQAQSASAANHTIFVFDGDNTSTGLSAGIDLKSGQRLIGESANLVVGADTLWTGVAAKRPTITDSNADVVALDDGNVVRGVELNPSGTGGAIAGAAGDAGGTIDDVRIIDTGTAATQPSLELDTTTGTFDISALTIDNSAATGVTSESIGVRLNNAGTVNFASAGTIAVTTAGAKGLEATGPTTNMGTGSVFDAITVSGSASGAVSMTGTTGTTTFGDLSLATTAGAPAAFLLNNAGNITVTGAGTATISAPGAAGVDVSNTSGPSLTFDSVSASPGTGSAISLAGLGSGTFAAPAGTISGGSGAGGNALSVNGGSGDVGFGGSVADGAGGTALVTGRTGGTVTMSGALADGADANGAIAVASNSGGSTVFSNASKVFNTGAGAAVTLSANTGHAISFTNGGLDIDTTSGAGFSAGGGGTVTVSGAGNSIASGSGAGLAIDNTTIGAGNVTFQSVSSNGATVGIRASATGASGRLVVTGSGGTCTTANTSGCSGGQIANATGADNSTSTPGGTGVVLNNTLNPSLTRMWIHDASNYGIRGTSVAGFTLADSVINGVNGTSALTANKDGSARFEELTGTVNVTNTEVRGGYFTNFMVDNTAGVLNATLDNVDSGTLDATGGDDAVQFEGIGTSTMNLTYQNSSVTTASGDLLQYIGDGTGGANLTLTGNTFTNDEPSIATGGGGIAVTAGAKGAATLNISNNTMRDALTNALTVIKTRDAAAGTNNLTATISNNTIGIAGTANSGSVEGDGMEITTFGDGNATFNVTNNTIRQYNSSGMQFVAGGGIAESGQFNLNISGNSLANPGTNPSITLLQGIRVDSGVVAGDTFQTCVNFGANAITGSSDAANKDFRLVASQSTTIRQPGYLGGATDGTAFAAFAAGKIGSGAQGTAVANAPATFSGTGATCP